MTGNKHSSSFRSLSTAINCRSDRNWRISCTAATALFYGNAQQPKFATYAAQLFPSFCAALLESTKLIKSLVSIVNNTMVESPPSTQKRNTFSIRNAFWLLG